MGDLLGRIFGGGASGQVARAGGGSMMDVGDILLGSPGMASAPAGAGGGIIGPQNIGLVMQAMQQATTPDAQLAKMIEAMMSRQPLVNTRRPESTYKTAPVPSPSAMLRSPMGYRF